MKFKIGDRVFCHHLQGMELTIKSMTDTAAVQPSIDGQTLQGRVVNIRKSVAATDQYGRSHFIWLTELYKVDSSIPAC
jgi:hypothetical protein